MRIPYKSDDDSIIFGIIGGLGEYFNFDSSTVRIMLPFFCLATGPTLIIIYLALFFIMPNQNNKK